MSGTKWLSIRRVGRQILKIESPHPPDRQSPLKASVSPGGGGTPPRRDAHSQKQSFPGLKQNLNLY